MYKRKTILAIIPARGGSKELPRKNIRLLLGKPLIAWTIEQTLVSKYLDRVVVSTDDEEIAEVSRRYGAEVPFIRPKELATDDISTVTVIEHSIRELENREDYKPDLLILLQPTSPLRAVEDIDNSIEMLVNNTNADALVSITLVSEPPYWMKVINKKGYLKDFIGGDFKNLKRQSLPEVYILNGALYVIKRTVFIKERTFIPPKTLGFIMPRERSIDIDSEMDLKLAEILMK